MEPKGKNIALNEFNKLIEAQEKELTSQKTKKRKKKENPLLRPPTGECQGWAFYVPRCFNAALDITFNASRKGRRAL